MMLRALAAFVDREGTWMKAGVSGEQKEQETQVSDFADTPR